MDETAERTLRAVLAGKDASESELWHAIRYLWSRRRVDHASLMTGLDGAFDPQRAANVIAAVLTKRRVPLRVDGELTPSDLQAFLARAAS